MKKVPKGTGTGLNRSRDGLRYIKNGNALNWRRQIVRNVELDAVWLAREKRQRAGAVQDAGANDDDAWVRETKILSHRWTRIKKKNEKRKSESGNQPQIHTDSHRFTQIHTDSHRFIQIHTDEKWEGSWK